MFLTESVFNIFKLDTRRETSSSVTEKLRENAQQAADQIKVIIIDI